MVQGLRFRVSGFKVWVLGFGVSGLGFQVWDFRFVVWSMGVPPQQQPRRVRSNQSPPTALRGRDLGFRIQGLGSGVYNLEFLELRVKGLQFRV
jgi:hypothetical protein